MKYATYPLLIVVGIFMVIGTLLKLMGIVYIDSDWFWFLAGCGLAVEGFVTLRKQKKFDKTHKVVLRKGSKQQ